MKKKIILSFILASNLLFANNISNIEKSFNDLAVQTEQKKEFGKFECSDNKCSMINVPLEKADGSKINKITFYLENYSNFAIENYDQKEIDVACMKKYNEKCIMANKEKQFFEKGFLKLIENSNKIELSKINYKKEKMESLIENISIKYNNKNIKNFISKMKQMDEESINSKSNISYKDFDKFYLELDFAGAKTITTNELLAEKIYEGFSEKPKILGKKVIPLTTKDKIYNQHIEVMINKLVNKIDLSSLITEISSKFKINVNGKDLVINNGFEINNIPLLQFGYEFQLTFKNVETYSKIIIDQIKNKMPFMFILPSLGQFVSIDYITLNNYMKNIVDANNELLKNDNHYIQSYNYIMGLLDLEKIKKSNVSNIEKQLSEFFITTMELKSMENSITIKNHKQSSIMELFQVIKKGLDISKYLKIETINK